MFGSFLKFLYAFFVSVSVSYFIAYLPEYILFTLFALYVSFNSESVVTINLLEEKSICSVISSVFVSSLWFAKIQNVPPAINPIIIAINRFSCDTEAELKVVTDYLDTENLPYAISNGPVEGETGSIDLAKVILNTLDKTSVSGYLPLYTWNEPIKTKIEKISEVAKWQLK